MPPSLCTKWRSPLTGCIKGEKKVKLGSKNTFFPLQPLLLLFRIRVFLCPLSKNHLEQHREEEKKRTVTQPRSIYTHTGSLCVLEILAHSFCALQFHLHLAALCRFYLKGVGSKDLFSIERMLSMAVPLFNKKHSGHI